MLQKSPERTKTEEYRFHDTEQSRICIYVRHIQLESIELLGLILLANRVADLSPVLP